MIKNTGHIKNPLTVISVFAGITEISGTVVLPFIDTESQSIYIWFLMLFPTLLVGVFFATLNWNHKTLYAPSDYQNEDNFVSSISKSSKIERVIKLTEEVNEVVSDASTPPDVPFDPMPSETLLPEAPSETTQTVKENSLEDSSPLATGASIEPAKKKRVNHMKMAFDPGTFSSYHLKNIDSDSLFYPSTFEQNRLSADIKLTEKLAIKRISKITGIKFETDIKFRHKNDRFILFDAASVQGKTISAVEVKLFKDGKFNRYRITKVLDDCQSIVQEDRFQIDNFILHLVIVAEIEDYRRDAFLEQIQRVALPYSFGIFIHLFSMKELERDL